MKAVAIGFSTLRWSLPQRFAGWILSMSMYSALVAGITAMAACDTKDTMSRESFLGRDTAGAEIIETAPPAEGELIAWEVDEEPALRIGAPEGEPWEMLYDVRDVRTLPDGRVAVAQVGSAQLLIYDGAGRFLQAIGRWGDGPGEFRAPAGIYVFAGDSLLIHDAGARSFSVFTLQGEFVRRFQHAYPAGVSYSLASVIGGVTNDGSVILAGGLPHQPEASPVRLHDLDALPRMGRVYRLAPDGRIVQEYGDAVMRTTEAAGGRIVFGPVAYMAAAGDAFHYGAGDRYEIRTYDTSGRLRRILRHGAPPRRVSAEMIARYDQSQSRNSEAIAQRQTMAGVRPRQHFAPVLPSHGQIRTSGTGALWVQRPEPFPASPRVWDVFSAAGAYEGMVRLADRFTLTEIGHDHVLGIWKDDHDVEYVVRYLLRRPGPAV